LNAGTVPGVSTKKCDRSPEIDDGLPPNSPIAFGRNRQSGCISDAVLISARVRHLISSAFDLEAYARSAAGAGLGFAV
jgi:hypothetical protein